MVFLHHNAAVPNGNRKAPKVTSGSLRLGGSKWLHDKQTTIKNMLRMTTQEKSQQLYGALWAKMQPAKHLWKMLQNIFEQLCAMKWNVFHHYSIQVKLHKYWLINLSKNSLLPCNLPLITAKKRGRAVVWSAEKKSCARNYKWDLTPCRQELTSY